MNWMQFAEERGAMTPCALCEAMVPDAVDGSLTPAEQRWFDSHLTDCTTCVTELSEAQRGAAWLHVLRAESPAPPLSLAAAVFAQTTQAVPRVGSQAAAPPTPQPVLVPRPAFVPQPLAGPSAVQPAIVQLSDGRPGVSARVLPFLRRGVVQPDAVYAGMHPRLAMTAAMAFFSLALTANILGVQPSDLRPGHLAPALRRTVNNARRSVIRDVEHAPLVAQLESGLRNNTDGGQGQ